MRSSRSPRAPAGGPVPFEAGTISPGSEPRTQSDHRQARQAGLVSRLEHATGSAHAAAATRPRERVVRAVLAAQRVAQLKVRADAAATDAPLALDGKVQAGVGGRALRVRRADPRDR